MKKFKISKMTIINTLLLFTLPISMINANNNVKKEKFEAPKILKNLSTTKMFSNATEVTAIENTEIVVEEEQQEEIENVEQKVESSEDNKNENKTEEVKEVVEEPTIEEEKKESVPVNTNRTFTGNMSFYNANCAGCSGITSTGVDVSDGKIYYNDPTYGNVRIIAAGPEIKKWSIVRISNSSLGNNVIAIVLDRGGDIGQNRRFLIDVLTNSTESRGGISKNITIEVLREGR